MANLYSGRREPYTEIGLSRMNCTTKGCTNRASFQWNACANGNWWLPICLECDIALNTVLLNFVDLPNKEILLKNYEETKRKSS